ncbi:MAG: cell wall-binding repeat-containing protein, partial [Peptococcaceae bacterium]|nr:cell wall-binding repeat-containing protein [Peptococcaceae bacterium]
MNKVFTKGAAVLATGSMLFLSTAGVVQAASAGNRFSGANRFQTSIAIARQDFQNQKVQNVVIASAYSFPDALAASTLATKLSAPIILVGKGQHDSNVSLAFIKNHLTKGGTVTIIGGIGIIDAHVQDWLVNAGYIVTRMGGKD